MPNEKRWGHTFRVLKTRIIIRPTLNTLFIKLTAFLFLALHCMCISVLLRLKKSKHPEIKLSCCSITDHLGYVQCENIWCWFASLFWFNCMFALYSVHCTFGICLLGCILLESEHSCDVGLQCTNITSCTSLTVNSVSASCYCVTCALKHQLGLVKLLYFNG